MEDTNISRRNFLRSTAVGAASITTMGLLSACETIEATVGLENSENTNENEANPASTKDANSEPLDTTIYCIDRFITKPGEGAEFLDYFLAQYGPKAQAYGMKLEKTLVAPPLWLDKESNTIEIIWSLAGFKGWSVMAQDSRYKTGEETMELWKKVNSMVVSRDRSWFGMDSDMEVLNNV